MEGLAAAVAIAIWVMLPAYIPNNVAVLVGGGPPMDAGRTWQGRRILGDGKTWRGTAGGILAGAVLAMLLNVGNGAVSSALSIDLPQFPLEIILAFPIGALLGDIAASFIKRRLDRERGSAVPGLDQLDFVVGALMLGVLLEPDWMFSTFTTTVFLIVIVLTPVLHLVTNAIAYALELKDEPW